VAAKPEAQPTTVVRTDDERQSVKTARERQMEVAQDLSTYKFGWSDPDNYVFEPKRGLSREVVEEISFLKSEPEWMRDLRLRAYDAFLRRPMPEWGGDLSGIIFDDIYYFVRATEQQATSWEELPADIKNTYDKLGIPEAEKQRLIAGVAAQYECCHSETRVYTANRGIVTIKEIEPGDVVFAMDEATGELQPAPVKAASSTHGIASRFPLAHRAAPVRTRLIPLMAKRTLPWDHPAWCSL
jgi:hypothetical protein